MALMQTGKRLLLILVLLTAVSTNVYANKFRGAYLTTGGATGSLDSLATSLFSDNDATFVMTDGVGYFHIFDSSATDAEDDPIFIRPDDFSSAGVHVLQSMSVLDLAVYGTTLSLEGATNDAFETLIKTADITASDKTFTFPNDQIANNDLIVGTGAGTFGYTAKSAIALSDFSKDLTAGDIAIASGGGSPTVDQVQEYLNNTGSSGFFLGGAISDGGSGTVDVAAGSGFIRTTNDDNAELQSFKWSASAGIAVADNTTQYIYVDDAGTISLSTNEFLEAPDKIKIGVVTDEAAAIEGVFPLGVRLEEGIGQAGRFMRGVHGIVRNKRVGGLIFGQSGDANRDVTMTTGQLEWGRTSYTMSAFDTSGADTFFTYSAGGQEDAAASGWPNAQYDNAGTLTTMTNNRWANLFFWLEPNDNIIMVYGRAEFVSQAGAEAEGVPSSSLPTRISATGLLATRLTFQKSANTATIESAFDTLFANAAVSDHGNLAGLTDDDHTQYVKETGTPVNDQIAIFTADRIIEGDPDFTFDGADVTCTGTMNANLFASSAADLEHYLAAANTTTPTAAATEGRIAWKQDTNRWALADGTDWNNNLVSDEDVTTKTAVGVVELATTAEIDTGTDATRAIPVDQFVASKRNIRWLSFNLVEAATDIATATNIAGDFVSPIAGTILQSDTSPFYLYATNSTAGTTGTMVIDISLGGTSIMTTNKLDFDTTQKTTTTAGTPPDLTDTTIAVGDILTIDVDAIHTTAAKGLTVYIAIRED